MDMHDVTVKLPAPLLQAAQRLAGRRDATLGHIIRAALSQEIRRSMRNAKTPNRADELLLAPLRALLAVDFAQAGNWDDLNARLAAKGYALREAGGGLALHAHPQGQRLCKASELGHAYSALMRRFNAPFPGHAHRHLVTKVLGQTGKDTDFDVIEPF